MMRYTKFFIAISSTIFINTASASNFIFSNNCDLPVKIAVRYMPVDSSHWRTVGWFEIAPNAQGRTLTYDNINLNSNNPVWYFSGKTTGELELDWGGGDDAVTTNFKGESLDMQKLTNNSYGPNKWSIDCSEKRKEFARKLSKLKEQLERTEANMERDFAKLESKRVTILAKDSVTTNIHQDSDYIATCGYKLYSNGKLDMFMHLRNKAIASGFSAGCGIDIAGYKVHKNLGIGATEGRSRHAEWNESIPVKYLEEATLGSGVILTLGDRKRYYCKENPGYCSKTK